MKMNQYKLLTLLLLLAKSISLIASQNNPGKIDSTISNYDNLRWSLVSDSIKEIIQKKNLQVRFMPPLLSASLSKSFQDEHYYVTCNSLIDSSQVLVSFNKYNGIESALIDYNHLFGFILENKKTGINKTFRLSKKKDLTSLKDKGFWTFGGLGPWSFIAYNEKFNKFVFSYKDYPQSNYGSYYYYILDDNGNIEFQGYDKSWGGGGVDGNIYVNDEFIVSGNEIYSFREGTSKNLKELVAPEGFHTFALRLLSDSAVLIVLHKSEIKRDENGRMISYKNTFGGIENALITTMNGEIIKRFQYQDMYEEMDYIFTTNENYSADSLLYFDAERFKLGIIEKHYPYKITEIVRENMIEVTKEMETKFNNMELLFKGFRFEILQFEIRISNDGNIYYKN